MEKMEKKATMVISLIGRPNVGKSTLFNRLQGKMGKAITHKSPGVTRDRHYAWVDLEEGERKHPIVLVDTAGLYPESADGNGDDLSATMREQVQLALEESDLILFVVDGTEGLLGADEEICCDLRHSGKSFAMVINKLDSGTPWTLEGEFASFGLPEESCFGVSAAHGRGILDLKEFLFERAGSFSRFAESSPSQSAKEKGESREEVVASLCLMGAPNGGKSTLLNRLLNAPRAAVSEKAGTTVDPVEDHIPLPVGRGGKRALVKIVDTAGIRKKPKVSGVVEKQSTYRALRAVSESDIVIYVVDVSALMTHQDRRLVDIALEKGASVIVALNKIDLLDDRLNTLRQKRDWMDDLRAKIAWLDFCTLVPLSAKEGRHLQKLVKAIGETIEARFRAIPTGRLNQVIGRLIERSPLYPKGTSRRHPLKVRYATVVKDSPPTILLFSNRCRNIPPPYRRYLQKGIRRAFSLDNTPIHLIFRNTGQDPRKKGEGSTGPR
ncbi:MAG: ribosome biogenesis GTPase Der [Bacteriovoracales bacterium]|nr:ribosome biogenesis GTPase Der [Bacteriovoracales bacterium]